MLGHIQAGHRSLLATTVAAYVIFGTALYYIFLEFKLFTRYKHQFCIRDEPENYSVYVSNIPPEYRSDIALLNYFQSIYSNDDVIEAKVVLDMNNLNKKCAQRKKIVEKLEHAVNVKMVKGKEPSHLTTTGQLLGSIPTFSDELYKLNSEISEIITKIEDAKKEEAEHFCLESARANMDVVKGMEEGVNGNDNDDDESEISNLIQPEKQSDTSETTTLDTIINNVDNEITTLDDTTTTETQQYRKQESKFASLLTLKNTVDNTVGAMGKTVGNVGKAVGQTVGDTLNVGKAVGQTVGGTFMDSINLASTLLGFGEDGEVLSSGFVTFSNLLTKNQCVQAVHHEQPFTFNVTNAPPPKMTFWPNIGRPHHDLQVGYLIAQLATAGTCLFWTFPVSFITSLSEVDNLKSLIPGMEKLLDEHEWLAGFLSQLSPLLLVALTGLLPTILESYCQREGHIGSPDLNASLLQKLAIFMIVQIFFVQAISGTVFDTLAEILDHPSSLIELLADSVPKQVKSFIQYVLVKVFLGTSVEMLRVTRVFMAIVRKFVGPNLTEKESNTTWMGLKPIAEPAEVEFPKMFAEMTLFFMILLIYSCVSPLMSYVMLVSFATLSVVYRHHFIYVYSREFDNGGRLWPRMIILLITCMIIAEITLFGILTLREGYLEAGLLLPLIGATVLFVGYIHIQHFRVTEVVPTTLCKATDTKSELDISLFKGEYLQPSLAQKKEYPDNFSESDVVALLQIDNIAVAGSTTAGNVEENQGIFDI